MPGLGSVSGLWLRGSSMAPWLARGSMSFSVAPCLTRGSMARPWLRGSPTAPLQSPPRWGEWLHFSVALSVAPPQCGGRR